VAILLVIVCLSAVAEATTLPKGGASALGNATREARSSAHPDFLTPEDWTTQVSVPPGETARFQGKIYNATEGTTGHNVKLWTSGFGGLPAEVTPNLIPQTPYSRRFDVTVTVSVPANTSAGTYSGTLYAQGDDTNRLELSLTLIVQPAQPPQGTPELVIVGGLQLDPKLTVNDGRRVMASFRLRNNGTAPATVKRLVVSARGPDACASGWSARQADFPAVENLTLGSGEEYLYQQSRAFDEPGVYFAEPTTMDVNGRWGGIKPYPRVWFAVANERDGRVPDPACLMVVDGVHLSTTAPQSGQEVVVSFKLRNNGSQPVVIKRLVAGARGPGAKSQGWGAPNVDFPAVENLTLQPGQAYEYQQRRTFDQPGDYFVEPAMQGEDGKWGGIWPWPRVEFEVAEAPASQTLCGQRVTVTVQTSPLSGYFTSAFLPCGSSTPYLLGTGAGSIPAGDFLRFYDPVTEPTGPLDSSSGPITTRLTGWSRVEPIAACQVCGLEAPSPHRKFSVSAVDLRWDPAPKAFKAATLFVKTQVEGLPEGSTGYVVHVMFGEDFPYRTTEYWFDSEDPVSARYLSPKELKDGEFEIQVSGLRFPATFDGYIDVVVMSKQNMDIGGGVLRKISVPTSDEAYRHCQGVILKVAEELLLKKIENKIKDLREAGKLTAELAEELALKYQVKSTVKTIEGTARMEICGDNSGCQKNETLNLLKDYATLLVEIGAELVKIGAETGAKLNPYVAGAILLKGLLEAGVESAKCVIWLKDLISAWLESLNSQGVAANGIITESPVYPLVTNKAGQRTGFLENGQVVEEIPDARAIAMGEKRIVLFPGRDPVQINVSGYAGGTMNLYATFAQDTGGAVTLSYENIPVTPGMKARLSSANSQHILEIDTDGDGQSDQARAPDKVESPMKPGPPPPSSGGVPGGTPAGPTTGVAGGGRARVSGGNLAPVILVFVLIAGLGTAFGAALLVRRQPGAAPPPSLGVLQVQAPDQPVQAVPLRRLPFTIGRGPGCDLVLSDPQVSRAHARIYLQGGTFILEDLGSTNGTLVNSRPVKRAILRPGDRIRVGQTTIGVGTGYVKRET